MRIVSALEPVRHEANVIVVHPYYQESWSFELREIEGLPVVSDVQLYLYPRRGAEPSDPIWVTDSMWE